MRKTITGIFIFLLVVPALFSATAQKPAWHVGSEFVYVQTMDGQLVEATMIVKKSELVDDHWCWRMEVGTEEGASCTWYDKDTYGIWKFSQKMYGVSIDSVFDPQPTNMILPIGDRSYDTNMKIEMNGQSLGDVPLSIEIIHKGQEEVSVPAGTFIAHHIVISQTASVEGAQPTTAVTEIWYSSEVGNTVKEIQDLMGKTLITELKSYKL